MSTSASDGEPGLIEDVLSLVIDHVSSVEDLKNIRLCNKLLAELAALRLFQSMTLVPFEGCLREFISFMGAKPHLAKCVRELSYDGGFRYHDAFVYNIKDHTICRHMIGFAVLDENDLVEQDLETVLLTRCLELLPLLIHLRVFEIHETRPHTCPRVKLPSYFRRGLSKDGSEKCRFSLLPVPSLSLCTRSVLLAYQSTRPKLHTLRIANFDFRTLLVNENTQQVLRTLPVYEGVFARLKEFDLHCGKIYESDTFGHYSPLVQENVRRLITATVRVERLHLQMAELSVASSRSRFPSMNSGLSPLARHKDGTLHTIATHTHLKSLRLTGMTCHQSELLAVVRNHRQTLKNLYLQDMTLTASPEDRDIPSCWVRLLVQLRPYRMTITLDGHFTNLRQQWWEVGRQPKDEPSPQTSSTLPNLKAQVQTWASGGGGEDICPIAQAAVRIDTNGKEKVVSEREHFRGDPSFKFVHVPLTGETWHDVTMRIGTETWDEHTRLNPNFDFDNAYMPDDDLALDPEWLLDWDD